MYKNHCKTIIFYTLGLQKHLSVGLQYRYVISRLQGNRARGDAMCILGLILRVPVHLYLIMQKMVLFSGKTDKMLER